MFRFVSGNHCLWNGRRILTQNNKGPSEVPWGTLDAKNVYK